MDANHNNILYPEESYQITGAAMDVLNELGPGLLEKPYENALVVEFRLRQIPYSQQARYPIIYKGVDVGEHIPDLVAFGKIVVDAKCVETITDEHRAVMLSYLRITGCRLGLYLNFKRRRLEVVRLVLERGRD
jgi:GxxExxY protein